MINYRLYRYYWPLMALGRFSSLSKRAENKSRVNHVNGSASLSPGVPVFQNGLGKNGNAPSPLTPDNRV